MENNHTLSQSSHVSAIAYKENLYLNLRLLSSYFFKRSEFPLVLIIKSLSQGSKCSQTVYLCLEKGRILFLCI